MLAMGVLLSEQRYRRLLAGPSPPWRARALRQEQQYGVRPVFLPPVRVDLDAGTARVAVATPRGWREEDAPLPRYCYNLLVRPAGAEAQALRRLNGDLRVTVFNETNRWNRGMAFEMLAAVPAVQAFIPPTAPCTPGAPDQFPPGPGPLLVTPARGPVRPGSFLLVPDGPDRLRYTHTGDGATGTLHRQELAAGLHRWLSPGLRWASRLSGWPVGPEGPAEWRLYVHRETDGTWAVAAAVAKQDALRLGTLPERCWGLETGLALTFGPGGARLAGALRAGALAVARALALFLPGMAHCALDFWIDRDGQVTLADLTGRYRVDWLRRAGDLPGLRRVISHPVRFTRALAQTGVGKLDVDFGRAGGPAGGGGDPPARPLAGSP